ncbi:MAG: IS110 family transposase [Armatimonadetes bacterium]|nr:IS110 family transposase [Armatimonadota bacterium]
MTHTLQTTALYVGIDVSKETLAVATYPNATVQVIPNDYDPCEALANELAAQPVAFVLLEASGGFEKTIVQALQRAGVPVAIVPTQRARYFAKSMRGNLKTDRVDAQMLARFASCYPMPDTPETPAVQAQLKELWARREQLVQMLESEQKRLQVATFPLVRESLERTIAQLQAECAAIEAAIEMLMASEASLSQKAALLQTVVGVGWTVASGVLAELAELGQVSHKVIAALAGLAPVRRESGCWRGYARISGGRSRVRRLLYLAAVVAVTHDARWKAVYQRLLAKGKPKKVALCAVARRLLVVMNAMVRDGRAYERTKE